MDRASRRLWAVPGLCVALALAGFGWMWLGRPIALPDVPDGRLQCLSYTPSSDAGSPLSADESGYPIPAGLIERDLGILKDTTGCVRTYSVLGRQGDVLAAAAAERMQVLLGVWIGADEARNRLEIDRALQLAHAHPEAVRAIVVGNEVLLRREMTGGRLAGLLRSVKARTNLPVAYADIYEFWRRSPEVAEAADLILLHILPYWDDPHAGRVEDAVGQARAIMTRARSAWPAKPIEIGEIGWPSAGRTRSRAAPGRVNEARLVRGIAAGAAALGMRYNLIEAIDQPWKRGPEGTVGGFWGVLDAGRRPKFPLRGPVSEWPRWRSAAAFTAAVSVAAFMWGLLGRARVSPGRWMLLGLAAPCCGAIGAALADQVATLAGGPVGWVWGALLLIFAAAGGAVLLGTVLGGPSPWIAAAAPLPFRPARLPHFRPGARKEPMPQRGATYLRLPRPPAPGTALGVLHWTVMLTAAVAALLLAVDGRHRDFLSLGYGLPAAAFALIFLRQRRDGQPPDGQLSRHPEAGWIAATVLVCGCLAIDHPANLDAWAWAGCCAMLSLPWLRYSWREATRIGRAIGLAIRAGRQQ